MIELELVPTRGQRNSHLQHMRTEKCLFSRGEARLDTSRYLLDLGLFASVESGVQARELCASQPVLQDKTGAEHWLCQKSVTEALIDPKR